MDWKNQMGMIQNKVKQQLHARKLDDLDAVRKLIDEFDIDRNGMLDKVEFNKLLAKAGIHLTTQELTCVYNYFDTNKDGYINYVEFIQLIRTQMSEKRLGIVKHAFQFLNVNNDYRLKIDDLLSLYRPDAHPRVRTREKTAEQVMSEFKNAIIKKSSDGVHITEADFLDYYADVNATLPLEKEEYFSDLVFKTWGITSGFNYVSPERIADLEAILYEKIRQKTYVKEDEAKTVKKAFKYFDLDDSGTIDLEKFTRALEKFGCIFNKYETQALFKKYDSDSSGKLCYDEFCNMFAVIGSGTNPNVNPVFELEREYPKDVIEQIRKDLTKKGLFGIRQLLQTFRKADKLNKGGITRNECQWALKEVGTSLTKHDLDKIFRYFDKKGDDFVRYTELVSLVRGDIVPQRADAINDIWHKLSQGSLDSVKFDVLQSSFDPYGLLDVRMGKTKPEHAFKDFISQWDVRKDGTVSYQDFFNFYQDLSAMVSDNGTFIGLLRDSWRIPEKKVVQQQEQKLGSPTKVESPTKAGGQPEKTMKNLSVRFADNVNIK